MATDRPLTATIDAPAEAAESQTAQRAPRGRLLTRRNLLWTLVFCVMGWSAALYLHWPVLLNDTMYRSDVRQSPHWVAYHRTSFRPDDLLIELARYNESPVQNLMYYVGTWFFDVVPLSKIYAILGTGLCSGLFFLLGQAMIGFRGGVLTAIAITFFPDQSEFFFGGFSKAWMIPLLLVCVYLLDRRRYGGLMVLMPFAALAYPVSAVMIGMVSAVHAVLLLRVDRREALRAGRMVLLAGVLGVAPLLYKYLTPSPRIGPLTPGSVLRDMPEMYPGGLNNVSYLPVPDLDDELERHVDHPFIIYSAIVFFVLSGNRGVGWRRPWTALVLASVMGYLLADYFFMSLYIPNRYTRYSMAVLLALWHGHNWDRCLARIPWRPIRHVATVLLVAAGMFLFWDGFKPGKRLIDRSKRAEMCRFISTLPEQILLAGTPKFMDDIPIQARRSVLCNYKLAHVWYSTYYEEIKRRTEATFRALYASDKHTVNRLAEDYGVTHLVVAKECYSRSLIRRGRVYRDPYNDRISELARRNKKFILDDPPKRSVVYEDRRAWIVELPLR